MKSLSLTSYAKLNLYLRVIRRRPDNYHQIFTIFEKIGLSDRIRLRLIPNREIKIISKGYPLPLGPANLAYQAASLLQRRFHVRDGVEIRIRKQIPVSSGLGGGSSNAACVLTGLNQIWKLNLTIRKLVALARILGSDAPFFLYNTSFAYATSRGDKIRVLRLPVKLWHVIVVPQIKILTQRVYKKWDDTIKTRVLSRVLANKKYRPFEYSKGVGLTNHQSILKILRLAILRKDILLLNRLLFNSLEEVSMTIYPEIRRIRLMLSDLGLSAISMSGSGSAVFGLVRSRKEGYGVARQLRKLGNWDVFLASTV